jgi:lipid-A-disaccharide synthase
LSRAKKIFIIAGEESGDSLGSKLIRAIKAKNNNVEFIGVGGIKMATEGLNTIFPMQEISLMGFLEVVPHLPKLIKRINETVDRIILEQPDVLVTIDSPGFNYRIAKKLKEKKFDIKKIHFVAPSVWAYKAHRAKRTAELFDHLIAILPWEPEYFEKEGLRTTFIGHPIFEDLKFMDEGEKKNFRNDYNYNDTDKVIAILPGSRMGEIKRLLPVFVDAAKKIAAQNANAKFILMPTENLRELAVKSEHEIPNCITVSDTEEKRKLLQVCDAAIVKSGTVALEVAALECPNIICYKINALSHWMIRKMLYIDFANLINIAAKKEIIRELIQEDCTSENIAKEISKLINSTAVARGQIEEAKYELVEMGLGATAKPSDKAADVVLAYLN